MAGTSSSLADRISRQYEQETGRPADAADPAYAEYIKTALPKMIADDRAALERSQGRWGVADKIAMGATLGLLGAGVGSALAGAGGVGAASGAGGSSAGAAGGSLPAIAGGSPWAVTPFASTVAMNAPGAIGAGVGAAGAAGGGSLLGRAMSVAGGVGDIMGNAGQAAAEGRRADNNQTLAQNYLTANLFNTRQNATSHALDAEESGKLNRAQLGLQAPTVRARQSILGSMMENMQPVTVSGLPEGLRGHVPTISGGLTPAMLSDTTRAHGKELQRAALAAQMSGSDIPGATDFKSGILDAPTMPGYQTAGRTESALGTGGLLGSIMGTIDDLINERAQGRG